MSLKVLKQQLKDFVVEEKPEETKKEKKRKNVKRRPNRKGKGFSGKKRR